MAIVIAASTGRRHKLCDVTLTRLQESVGGYIELVRLADGCHMYVNEDGLMLNLPYNVAASVLAGRRIVGDVVLLTRVESLRELDSQFASEGMCMSTMTVNCISVDVEIAKGMVGAIDQREALSAGCESWSIMYGGGQVGWMTRWPNGRGAVCWGGDSSWGDWGSDGLHLDNNEYVVDTAGYERRK